MSGGKQDVFGLVNGATVFAGAQVVESGGRAAGTMVKAGGVLAVESGAVVTGAVVSAGGLEVLFTGGSAAGTVNSGGALELVGSNPVATAVTFNKGGVLEFGSGYTINTSIFSGGTIFKILGGSIPSAGGTVISGGVLYIVSGGVVSGNIVSSGGVEIISAGGTASDTVVSSGGTEIVASGGIDFDVSALPGGVVIVSGGTESVTSGSVVNGLTIKAGGLLQVASGATSLAVTVSSGGTEALSAGSIATGSILSGGVLELVGSSATSAGVTVSKSAILELGSGYVATGNVSITEVLAGGTQSGGAILSGGMITVLYGGLTSNLSISRGGTLVVLSGGLADPTTIYSGGKEVVSANGTDAGAQISGGTQLVYGLASGVTIFAGLQVVESGGTAVDVTIYSGGTTINAVGGTISVQDGATVSGTLVNSGAVNVADGAILELGATILNNKGSLNLQGVDGGAGAQLLIDNNLTLTGGGRVSLSSNGNDQIVDNGNSLTLTNVNNTISGAGTIGQADGLLTLNNSGTVNANGSSSLIINTANTVINTGLLEGTSSGGLDIQDNVNNFKTIGAIGAGALVTIDNQGFGGTIVNTAAGVIEALGNGADVQLNNATILGGVLKTSGSNAIIEALDSSDDVISGAINSAVIQVDDFATPEVQGASLINNNTIIVAGSDFATLALDNNLSLTGGGKVLLSADGANGIVANGTSVMLTNVNNTIGGAGTIGQGDSFQTLKNSGTINANTPSSLIINTGNTVINTGLLEGTSSGGLDIQDNVNNFKTIGAIGAGALVTIDNQALGGTVTNSAAGVIEALGSGADVQLVDATIFGGVLKTSGTNAIIEAVAGTDDVISGAINSAVIQVDDATLEVQGTSLVNNNTITLAGFGLATLQIDNNLNLTGGGRVLLSGDGANGIVAIGTSVTLTNVNNSIAGAGTIGQGDGLLTLKNSGTINANAPSSLIINTGNTVTNTGLLEGTSSGGLDIQDNVNNFKTIGAIGAGALVTIDNQGLGGTKVSDSGKVTFAGPTGTLWLDKPSTFTGKVADFGAHEGIDLPGISFGAHTTLGYSENSSETGGTLTVKDGTHIAKIALLGNYMAASFVTAADGHGGTLVTETALPDQQPMLARPHAQ